MTKEKPATTDSGFLSADTTPSEVLTAYERWELPAMDADLPDPNQNNALRVRPKPSRRKPRAEPEPDEVDADELRPPTAEEIEAIRQAAYDEGFATGKQDGKKAGYKAGYDAGQSDVKAVALRLSQICRTLLEPIPAQDDELEEALLTLVRNICERVVQRELLIDSQHIVSIVRTAIDCLKPGHKRVRIHVNPGDAEHLARELKAVGEYDDNWRILPHPTITPGGCIVDTDTSLIDVRAEKRLAGVIRQVYNKLDSGLAREEQGSDLQQIMGEVATFSADADEDDDDSDVTD